LLPSIIGATIAVMEGRFFNKPKNTKLDT
jgi:hypothetical protein